MKQLKFNEGKILKALLDKSKTSTIRKAWRVMTENFNRPGPLSEDKPCKYKVGETLEVVWTGCYDNNCVGIGTIGKMKEDDSVIDLIDEVCNLGKVEITSIEEIEIGKTEMNETLKHPYWISSTNTHLLMPGYEHYGDTLKALSKSEGFKDSTEMFEYLEKYSGSLDEAKKFYLIKYKWVKCNENKNK